MRYVLYACIACVLYGCNNGVLRLDEFTFVAPEAYDGPISLPIGRSTGHYFMRMVGDEVARIDLALVREPASASQSLFSASQQCVLGGMKGRSRSRAICQGARRRPSMLKCQGLLLSTRPRAKAPLTRDSWLVFLSQPSVCSLRLRSPLEGQVQTGLRSCRLLVG